MGFIILLIGILFCSVDFYLLFGLNVYSFFGYLTILCGLVLLKQFYNYFKNAIIITIILLFLSFFNYLIFKIGLIENFDTIIIYMRFRFYLFALLKLVLWYFIFFGIYNLAYKFKERQLMKFTLAGFFINALLIFYPILIPHFSVLLIGYYILISIFLVILIRILIILSKMAVV